MNPEPSSPVVDQLPEALALQEKVALLAGKNIVSKWTYGSLTTWVPCGVSLAATFGLALVERHFILNDTEARRFNADQTIDKRTLREVYMKPFTIAVQDSALSTAMASYSRINGLHADLIQSLLATTDLEMPGPLHREQTVDGPVFHQIAREAAQSGLVLLRKTIVSCRFSSRSCGRCQPTEGGAGSTAVNPFHVTTPEECLWNPIRAVNPKAENTYQPGILDSLRAPFLEHRSTVPDGSRQGSPRASRADHDGDAPTSLIGHPCCYRASGLTGRSLGSSSEDQMVRVHLEAGRAYRLRVDIVVTLPLVDAFNNTLFPRVSDSPMLKQVVASVREADVVVVGIVGHNKDSEVEGGDRAHMQLSGSTNELVAAVCAANFNTMVVVQSSAVTMPWVGAAAGIVAASYQGQVNGQVNGQALVQALLGHCNFSGKLPITFPRRLEDHSSYALVPRRGSARSQHLRRRGEMVQVYVSLSAKIAEMGLIAVPVGESREAAIPISGSQDAKAAHTMDSTSVACLNCREKHLKCDGVLSGCARCQSLSLPCHFIPSRRGRKCRPAVPDRTCTSLSSPMPSIPFTTHLQEQQQQSPQPASLMGRDFISLYYLHFHEAHPFLPPMEVLLQSNPPSYLLDIMELISMHYLSPHFFHNSSSDFLVAVQAADLTVEKTQALLLLAIVQHGQQQAQAARSCLGQALQCALELGLDRRDGSDALSVDAPLRAESLRRTWWEIFVVDVLLAAVQVDGYLQFEMKETPNVPLPCAPEEYQPGCTVSSILPTFADMERNSLFCSDIEFTPCAYRIEAAMMLRKCLRTGGAHATKETLNVLSAAITAWFHRLPSRRPILRLNGVVDEIMMQAVMMMHCATIYLHFSRSCLLAFLPITGRIMCSSPPAFVTTSLDPQLHTVKVAEGAVQLSSLASLSTTVVNHTPFFACTLVLSSVIQVAVLLADGLPPPQPRQQYLALNLGVLKSMGETWPIAASAMQRIRQAAIEVSTTVPCDTRSLLDVFTSTT
ncbi:glycosyl hydrolase family 3 C-terminal domain-containing protein [Aspergillus falconensis]